MRTTARLVGACLLWGLWLVLSVVALLLPARGDSALGIAAVGYASVGLLVAWRHPHNAVGWLLMAFAVGVSADAMSEAYALTGPVAGRTVAAWVAQWADYVWIVTILVFIPLLFPTGHLVSRRWAAVPWLGAAALASTTTGAAFKPENPYTTVTNPFGAAGVTGEMFSALEFVGAVLLLVSALLTGVTLVVRFRRSLGTERQQLKWFGFAAMLIGAACLVSLLARFLPGAWSERAAAVGWTMLVVATLCAVPPAIGIAIFRHRLYDIDLVINRALVYGGLTATLVTTYVLTVLVLGRALTPLAGGSNLAVAGSTLTVAALFRPARRHIQDTVDRRFYRHRYDAARTLDEFTARLRHQLDLDAVGADLCAAAEDTVQPTYVFLWIRP